MDNFHECEYYRFIADTDGISEVNDDFYNVYVEYNFHEYEYDVKKKQTEILWDYKSWLPYIFNRTLYPVDWLNNPDEFLAVPSLIYFCCVQVTRDVNFLKDVLIYLPTNRYDLLMHSAISNDFNESAAVLMNRWPFKTISTRVVNSNVLLRCAMRKSEFITILARRIMFICELFFGVMKNGSSSPLRVLDLRGVPMSDAMIYFLLLDITNIGETGLDNYHIIVDCAINSSCTLEKFTSFFSMVNLSKQKYNPQLHINSIDVSELNEIQCWTLLQSFDRTDLVGLSVNPRFSLDFYTFVFTNFSSLKTLDIPTSKLPKSDSLPFHLIPNLSRLGCAIGCNNVHAIIPNGVPAKLEYLDVSGNFIASLVEDDFRCLMKVPPVLRELNLSGHLMVEEHLNLWRDFLRLLAPTLVFLELNSCLVDENLFPSFVSFILPLTNLQYFSLEDIPFSMKMLHEFVPILTSMPKLKKMRIGCGGSRALQIKGLLIRRIYLNPGNRRWRRIHHLSQRFALYEIYCNNIKSTY